MREASLNGEARLPSCIFNIIRHDSESKRCVPFRFDRDVRHFVNFIDSNRLFDLKYKAPCFTWSDKAPGKGQRFKRLDRCLVSDSYLEAFPNAILENLPRASSDHCAILLHENFSFRKHDHRFQFEHFWLNYREVRPIIENAWKKPDEPTSFTQAYTRIIIDVLLWLRGVC